MTPRFFKSFILVNIFIILTNLFETFIRFFRKTSVITVATLHPLNSIARKASHHQVKRHRSPIHNLLRLSGLKPEEVECVNPVRRSPGYVTSFKSYIAREKDKALELALL